MTDNREANSFEEAFRVFKIDDTTYQGAHALGPPLKGARGVYGGHTVAQTLLVAMETAGDAYRPQSFHSFFIAAGDYKVPMTFKVERLLDDGVFFKVSIKVEQKGRKRLSCTVSLVKKGTHQPLKDEYQIPPAPLKHRLPHPEKLHVIEHTDYLRNAYSDELVKPELAPEEKEQPFAQRWITLFSGVKPGQSFSKPGLNYVGLADLTDSGFLTTLARVLHIPWNPTEENPYLDHDPDHNALNLLKTSINVLHLYHYNAMSLDHHIYFNSFADDFDISRDWLSFTYQMRRLSNNRTLVRGFMYDQNDRCVATVYQEGLTYLYRGIPEQVRL